MGPKPEGQKVNYLMTYIGDKRQEISTKPSDNNTTQYQSVDDFAVCLADDILMLMVMVTMP